MNPADALAGLWQLAGLPEPALDFVRLTGHDPVLPSSFAVGTAACEVGHARGAGRQQVSAAMEHAALECTGWFSIDGLVPELWDPFSGLYRCADGWVRIHANFAHHREGALRLLGLDPATASRADAQRAMLRWQAVDFETAAAERALVATALRSFDVWDATEQGQAVARQPLFTIERIGDAPPLGLPHLGQGYRPGGLESLGYGPDALARRRPGIVSVSLSAYGNSGPWAGRRGFDSLLQTAMGFNHAEGEAAGDGQPRPLPLQILDEATGHLIAFGACAALLRQQSQGGSWHVQVPLAQTAQWLRSLGRVDQGLAATRPSLRPYVETAASGFGELAGVRPSAQLPRTPAGYARPSQPPGYAQPHW